ncbi:MAG: hypothetical protein ABR974_00210 [Bacteroidales bacterium]
MQIRLKNIVILLMVSFILNDSTYAQQTHVKKDSTILYKKIESYSEQGRVKKFMFGLVFKPVANNPKKTEVKIKGYKKLIQKSYRNYEGKIIRNINIATLDPFGYSSTDTGEIRQNFFYRAGDMMHIKTQNITIRNLILIHKNEPFNTLLVKESERLIRSQKYVHEVCFYIISARGAPDSVDIIIRELDKWSIIPEGSVSSSGFSAGITEKNFLGSGHEFQNTFIRNFNSGINTFITNYFIPNIRNTYINTTLHYSIDGQANFTKSLVIDRPFFSPLTKWAAGISFISVFKNDSLKDLNSVYAPIKLKFLTQDYWFGYAHRLFRNNADLEKITNLIFAVRYLNIRYYEKPSEFNDPLHIYSGENFYLASIGISTRKYVQDKYVFEYGVVEDVPVGKVYELTGGYQVRNNYGRLYLGLRFSFGNYYSWGYLSPILEYGTFIHSSHTEQGVFSGGVNYFTGLIEIGKWKFRQFVKPQFIIGLNRFSYDSLTLNDGYGLDGFQSKVLSGTRRLLITFQTQSYSPWHLIGFHFGPFLVCSFGMLGNDVKGFKHSSVYSQVGVGILFKNENLVFNTFQISISFYPLIPGNGQDIFIMNSFRTSDFGFNDFVIGKPGVSIYN